MIREVKKIHELHLVLGSRGVQFQHKFKGLRTREVLMFAFQGPLTKNACLGADGYTI